MALSIVVRHLVKAQGERVHLFGRSYQMSYKEMRWNEDDTCTTTWHGGESRSLQDMIYHQHSLRSARQVVGQLRGELRIWVNLAGCCREMRDQLASLRRNTVFNWFDEMQGLLDHARRTSRDLFMARFWEIEDVDRKILDRIREDFVEAAQCELMAEVEDDLVTSSSSSESEA